MGKLDELIFHYGCDTTHCQRCQNANIELENILYSTLGDRMDWLGRYHGWLKKQGIQPETDGGWWSREALNDSNVARFIAIYQEGD